MSQSFTHSEAQTETSLPPLPLPLPLSSQPLNQNQNQNAMDQDQVEEKEKVSSSTMAVSAAASSNNKGSLILMDMNMTPSESSFHGTHQRFKLNRDHFDKDDPDIKRDLMLLILQYLSSEGLYSSMSTLSAECQVSYESHIEKKNKVKKFKKAIMEGDWSTLEQLCTNELDHYRGLLFLVYRQQYLELIDRQENQTAFTFLQRKLKPLEHVRGITNQKHFADLCYLLTCKSVQEVDSFRDWQNATSSREKLVQQFESVLEYDSSLTATGSTHVPSNRLIELIQQAVSYQIITSRYRLSLSPKVRSLLTDFQCFTIPDTQRFIYRGHKRDVKSCCFVGEAGNLFASGSTDKSVKLWNTDTGALLTTFKGHEARVWEVNSDKDSGQFIVSASADGTVKLWPVFDRSQNFSPASPTSFNTMLDTSYSSNNNNNINNTNNNSFNPNNTNSNILSGNLNTYSPLSSQSCSSLSSVESSDSLYSLSSYPIPNNNTNNNNNNSICKESDNFMTTQCLSNFVGHTGDVYTCDIHPRLSHVVSGGYDHIVNLYDIETQQIVRSFNSHTGSVCSTIFNPSGNIIISGSSDNSIKFFDIVSGVCVSSLTSHLGAVCSVSMSSSGLLLLSSSKDNSNRLWDVRSSRSTVRYKGHLNTSKSFIKASFGGAGIRSLANNTSTNSNNRDYSSMVVGGSEDGCVYEWEMNDGSLLTKLKGHEGVVYDVKWNDSKATLISCGADGTIRTWCQTTGVKANEF